MISKWMALTCLVFFLAMTGTGLMGAAAGVTGIILSLAMMAAYEIASQMNEKDFDDLEARVKQVEAGLTSMKNIDRLRNEIAPRRKA